MKVITRMAPSPTGEYHIGHIRTLLYNYALAKKYKGKFILRIEDTDRNRFIKGATEKILSVIKAYGFSWDEGPIYQSERLDLYKKYAEELIASGHAYRCFCTPERLSEMREDQRKQGLPATKYDRKCLALSQEESEQLSKTKPFVIRQKMPEDEKITFKDVVYGEITYNSSELDDQVLLKSDGYPTYQLAVVVDDHLMDVTHVMRGNDWIPSTPKHVLLYKAFGWNLPEYIHLPNLKEIDSNKKLSKRNGPVTAQEFLDQGYLPEAINNFLMFLGWNPGDEQEIYNLQEFVDKFDPKKIHKTDLVAFDRAKLDWFNMQYIQKLSPDEFSVHAAKFAKGLDKSLLKRVSGMLNTRIKKFSELPELVSFFVKKPKVDVNLLNDNAKEHLKSAEKVFNSIINWNLDTINEGLMHEIRDRDYKVAKFFMNLRIAITGSKITPPINDSIYILGKIESLERINEVLKKL